MVPHLAGPVVLARAALELAGLTLVAAGLPRPGCGRARAGVALLTLGAGLRLAVQLADLWSVRTAPDLP